MFEVQEPLFLNELRIKNRFLRRDFSALFNNFFVPLVSCGTRRAVIVVSHSGTISNMLYSHTGKCEAEVLKPRNASVIAVSDTGRLGLRHEGVLPHCKSDEWHEYFTVPQFEQFASDASFDYTPPPSCLLLLVRHGVALNNVNKAYTDGGLTREGEASIVKAGLRIQQLLEQAGIDAVHIFSSACIRTRHSSVLLYDTLGGGVRRPRLAASRSLPCLRTCAAACGGGGGAAGEGEGEEDVAAAWLQGAVPVAV